ncbi:MAG: epoxyqueuosine reductase QueH [bacterium]|nr:epoxyqueuosine reductase QueH [bacterium]
MLPKKQKLLLHICCAPCATYVINLLKEDYEIFGFFYNPNIYPQVEYFKRLKEAKKYTINLLPLFIGNYESKRWNNKVVGLEREKEGGKRCSICFRIRLEKTANIALKNNFFYFATTLSVSPYKNVKIINQIGQELEGKLKIKFLAEDFKKKDGYKISCQLSKKHNLYRQSYCGCVFSAN